MSLLNVIFFSLGGAIIITMALGIVLSAFMPLDRWSKRYFIVFHRKASVGLSSFRSHIFPFIPGPNMVMLPWISILAAKLSI